MSKPEAPTDKVEIFPNPFKHLSCEQYNCRSVAEWLIGKKDGPQSLTVRICDKHARQLFDSMKQHVGEEISLQVPSVPTIDEIIQVINDNKENDEFCQKLIDEVFLFQEPGNDSQSVSSIEDGRQEIIEGIKSVSGASDVVKGENVEIICSVCDLKFDTHRQLNGHMTKHRNEASKE